MALSDLTSKSFLGALAGASLSFSNSYGQLRIYRELSRGGVINDIHGKPSKDPFDASGVPIEARDKLVHAVALACYAAILAAKLRTDWNEPSLWTYGIAIFALFSLIAAVGRFRDYRALSRNERANRPVVFKRWSAGGR